MPEFNWSKYEVKDDSNKNKFDWGKYEEKTTIGQDIGKSISSIPSSIVDTAMSIIREAPYSAAQVVTNPLRAAENVGSGLLEGVKGAYNLPLNISEYLGNKDIPYFKQILPIAQKLKIGDTGLQKKVLGEDRQGDELIRSLASFIPYSRIGSGISGIKGLGRRAAGASAFGAGQDQDPLHAAFLSLFGEGVGSGAKQGINAAKNLGIGKIASSPLSLSQLEKVSKLGEDLPMDLGNAIQNPLLQRLYENTLSKFPFSGAGAKMDQVASGLISKGSDLISDMAPKNLKSEDISSELSGALKEKYREVEGIKRKNYSEVNRLSEKEQVTTPRENFINTAKSLVSKAKADPALKKLTGDGLFKLAETLSADDFVKEGGISGVMPAKNVRKQHSIQNSDYLKSKLNEAANNAKITAGQGANASFYGQLAKSIRKDIDLAIDEKGSKELKETRDNAHSHYAKEFSPFLKKDIYKHVKGDADPDTLIQNFVKPSRTIDRGTQLKKLTDKIPQGKENLVALSYFQPAFKGGKFNPLKLKSLYENLGDKQKSEMFKDPATHEKLKDYFDLVGKNKKSMSQMLNLETGQKGSDLAPLAVGSLAHGAGGYAGVAATLLGAKGATNLLTNPKFRKYFIQKIIESRSKQKTKIKPNDRYSALSKALVSSQKDN